MRINESSKVKECKINTQKQTVFLHTGNEHSENEIKKTHLFMITLNNKTTRYNFNKKSQDLYIENYKAL